MNSREILQQILSVFSVTGDDNSRTCTASGGNAAPDKNTADLVTRNFMSEQGIQLLLPCLDGSAKPEGKDRRPPYEIPFPAALLNLLMKQNYFWHRDDKRHSKDTTTSEKQRADNYVGPSNNAKGATTGDGEKKDVLDCNHKDRPKRLDKKETITLRIGKKLEFNIPYPKDNHDETSSNLSIAIQTMHSNLKETIKILVYDILVSLTAKLLYKSITTNGTINIQTAKNLAGSLPSAHDLNTELNDHMAVLTSLESWKPPPNKNEGSKKFVSEEEDAQMVAKSLLKFEPPFSAYNRESMEKKFTSEEEDARLVADSLKAYPSSSYSNTYRGGSTLEGGQSTESTYGKKSLSSLKDNHDEDSIHPALCRASSLSYRHLCDSNGDVNGNWSTCKRSASHIASIKTIHREKSINDAICAAAMDSARTEGDKRLLKISIKKYSNDFATSPSDSEGDASGSSIDATRVTVPIQMDCKVTIQIGSFDFNMGFEAPGIIIGNFDDQSSSLTKVNLTLNDKLLVENLFKEIYKATKLLILSNKSHLETLKSRTTERSSVQSNGDHLEAAHALSQIIASPILQNGKKKLSQDMSPKRNVKRVRIDSMDGKSSSQGPTRRRSRMSSLDAVTEAIRMTENGHARTLSDINNNHRDTWFQQPNYGGISDIDLAIGSFRKGSGSGGHGDSSAASYFRRDSGNYNMDVAAEAARLADKETNINSLANFYPMDNPYHGSINGSMFPSPIPATLDRRPSYSNKSISQSAQEGTMQHFWGGENTGLQSSYLGSTGTDSQLMNQVNRGNGNLNSLQSNFLIDNWYGNATAKNPETMHASHLQAESRRRSSVTEAIRLVEMEALRRSSAGMSMAAAAEAVRLSEMNPYMNNQRKQSFAPTAESFLTHSESFDNLAALMRRSSGPNGSMASAANAVSLAELENWSRRSFTGHNNK